MKKIFLLLLTAASLLAGPSLAQNPPATDRPNNNAVNSSGQNNSSKPVEGANSFTEGQAKSKIEDAGYSNVTSLKKDDNGVSRGKASKGGASTNVSLDFQGNVIVFMLPRGPQRKLRGIQHDRYDFTSLR